MITATYGLLGFCYFTFQAPEYTFSHSMLEFQYAYAYGWPVLEKPVTLIYSAGT